jgi:tetratricopeptide (TPR) repeat protein
MDIKLCGDKFFLEKKYDDAITYYTSSLDFVELKNKHLIYLNRGLTYIKLKKYKEALDDTTMAIKLKMDYGKSWGRLGSILLFLNKHKEASHAFQKAHELEPTNLIYKKLSKNEYDTDTEDEDNDTDDDDYNMEKSIRELKELSLSFKSKLNSDNTNNNDVISHLLNKLLNNDTIMKRMFCDDFQNKILNYNNNPQAAFKDKEIVDIMRDLLK